MEAVQSWNVLHDLGISIVNMALSRREDHYYLAGGGWLSKTARVTMPPKTVIASNHSAR